MKMWLFGLLLSLLALPAMASEVSITTTKVPNGTVDAAYSAVIKATGGCTPYSWSLVSGRLPTGVRKKRSPSTTSLDLSGTPAIAAIYSFTIAVTGCGGHVSKRSYRVIIQSTAEHVVDLNWEPSTSGHIAGYNVYRGPNGSSWQKINAGLVAATLYDDATVANGDTYYYAVTAVDIYGNESAKTSAVKAVIP